MEQKKKNIRLVIVLGVLICISIALYIIPNGNSSPIKNTGLFQIKDTTGITSVIMKSVNFENKLYNTDSGWVINHKYLVDQSMMVVLFSVMENVEILRKTNLDQPDHGSSSDETIEVSFNDSEGMVLSFSASSNPTKTLSIFSVDDASYIVNLPGYDSFVTGIFQIPESDWRNRLIVSMGPLNMEAIKVNYRDDSLKNFDIQVQNNFPYIPSVNSLDTLQLMDYLDQFSYLQVDQFINPNTEPALDSLSKTNPWITFSFEEINSANNVTLSFYHKLRNDPNILARLNNQQFVLFNYQRIAGFFQEKEDFIKQ